MIKFLAIVFHVTLLIHASIRSSGQDLAIKRIELEGEKVYLYYDLVDTMRNRFYTINLYSSRDNFINPIKNITGKYGLEVSPGINNKIEVNAKEEFGADFDGKAAFEIRAKIYTPFIRTESFDRNPKFKRSKFYEIAWQGGRPFTYINFDLFEGNEKRLSFNNVQNTGSYNLFLPNSIKPGKDYHFRISDSKNAEMAVLTKKFSIIRKVPLLYKIIPTVILGGFGYMLFKSESDCQDCIGDFPLPPSSN